MSSVSINPPKTPVTKGSNGIAAATLPNVCKMPGPPAPFVPTPLPNIGESGNSPKGYSTSVKIEGQAVGIQGASFGSQGDMASKGTGGGIVSMNTHGPTKFVGPGSFDVKIEGKRVQFLGDQMLNNCGPSGNPANSATMTGVMQAPGVMKVIYGDDLLCDKCKKDTHPISAGPETRSTIHQLLKLLNEKFKAQEDKIRRLSQLHYDIFQKNGRIAKLGKNAERKLITPDEAAELITLELDVKTLEVESEALKAYFSGNAVLRWDPRNRTYSKGYMVGVLICICQSKKLAASSSKSPPGFAAAVASAGFQLASPPAVAPTETGAQPTAWECAAKQMMEKVGGHKPEQMIESLFMPAVVGLKPGKSTKISFQLTELDGTVRMVEDMEFKDGDDVPSCDQCQKNLPAMYCENKC